MKKKLIFFLSAIVFTIPLTSFARSSDTILTEVNSVQLMSGLLLDTESNDSFLYDFCDLDPDEVIEFTDDITLYYYNTVLNDVTGNWRLVLTKNNFDIYEYMKKYHDTFKEDSVDECVHCLVYCSEDPKERTTTCINLSEKSIEVTVGKYVPGETQDAKLMFTGDYVKSRVLDVDTGFFYDYDTGESGYINDNDLVNNSESNKNREPDYKALDYVTLGPYKNLEVAIPSLEVTESDIQDQFYNDCNAHNKIVQIKEGEVSDGDTVNINYVGTIDGVEFDGGSDKDVDLTIGSGKFISGFEESLIGAVIGEKTDVNVTFPDPYEPNTSMSGKDAVFSVTINFVKKAPEMTDELVAEISNSKTVEEYRKALEESIRNSKESMQDTNKINGILNLLYSESTINGYPEDVVSYRVADMKNYYSQLAKQNDMDLDAFLQQQFQITEEQMDSQWPNIVRQSMIQELLLKAVAESEGMEVTEEEYDEGLDRYVDSTGSESKDALLSVYSEVEIRRSILLDKALDFLKENTTVKVKHIDD